MRPGLGGPRVMVGNVQMLRNLRPEFGAYFIVEPGDDVYQWDGTQWQGPGGTGIPSKDDLLREIRFQAAQRSAAPASSGGSMPGVRTVGTDPSVTDPALLTAPPVPHGLPRWGGMDIPTLKDGGGDSRSQTRVGSGGSGGSPDTDSPQIFDNFENETLVGAWGTNRPSHLFAYVDHGGGAFHTQGVQAGYGYMRIAGAGISGFCFLEVTAPTAPWANAAGFDVTMPFLFTVVPGAGKDVTFSCFLTFAGFGFEITMSTDVARGRIVLADANVVQVLKNNWVANTLYNVRWQRGAQGGAISRLKVWTGVEPGAWTLTSVGAGLGAVTDFEWDFANGGGGAVSVLEARIFDIQFA